MINVESLPREIHASARAVVWNREVRDGGKPTKVPYIPHRPSDKASVNDPATWGAFPDAIAAVQDGKADGVGVVLGDGRIGIDLDDCRDPATGEITPEAWEIIRTVNSYTEISPSDTGVHILVHGTLPPGRKRKGWIEMYDDGRYFTLTGQHLAGTPATIEDRTTELAPLHARVFPPAAAAPPRPAPAAVPALDLDDRELIEIAHHARNGAAFAALWNGDATAHSSHSEADLALANALAFYTRRDAARMDRLFRQSGLFRPKWDKRRGQSTYGEITIEKAIAGCRETYSGRDDVKSALPPDRRSLSAVDREDSSTAEQPVPSFRNRGSFSTTCNCSRSRTRTGSSNR